MSSRTDRTRLALLDAAWALALEGETVDLKMGAVAERAGVSRQALYLHFGSRTGLLTALVDHIDERQGLKEQLAWVAAGVDAKDKLVRSLVVTARYAPAIDGLVRILDHARLTDGAAQEAWDDRMALRRRGLAAIVKALEKEGRLRPSWTSEQAIDAIWNLTEPRTYTNLVVVRGWTVEAYEAYLVEVVTRAFVADPT